jgi:uncharacterized tellurite resistance protein B-like protein
MALIDRIAPLCDLLLGAAYADNQFKDREREEVQGMLEDLTGAKLTPELDKRITTFDPKKFDLTTTANAFRSDPDDDRRRVLFLVAAINEADDEIDLAEDEYLRALCKALALPDEALAGMTIDVEIEDLQKDFSKIRKGPPPPPIPKDGVDVDV